MIQFRTLGALELTSAENGAVGSVLAQPRRAALLCYLALASPRGFHRRDTLFALFWPEHDAEQARHALRQSLYFLRRALGTKTILSRGDEELALAPDQVRCDAWEFEQALDEGRPADALALYRGELLAGFHISAAPDFEHWLDQERARLTKRAGEAGWALATARENFILPLYWEQRRATDLFPTDETALRRLILLLQRLGDRAAAVRAYEAYARKLQAEYELEPSAETRALLSRVRAGPAGGQAVENGNPPADAAAELPAEAGPAVPVPRQVRPPSWKRAGTLMLLLFVVGVVGTFLFLARRPGEPAAGSGIPVASSESLSVARPTGNPQAHTLYLKGRYFWNKRTHEDIQTALEYFQQAVDLDPGYSRAWVGIADTWIFRGWYSRLAPPETFPRAKRAVAVALEFDSTLAEAHASLAHIHLEFDHDWEAAEREYRRAIELNPEYPIAHHWYGGFLSAMGRHREALQQAEIARTLDPLSLIIQTWIGLRYYFAGHYEAAIAEYQKALELDHDFAPAHWHLGWAYAQTGRFEEAIVEAQRAVALDGGTLVYLASLGHAYARAGRRREARATLARLAQESSSRHVSAYHVAAIHLALEDTSSALDWLERAYEEQSSWMGYVGVDPRFEALRSHPRFESLLTKLRLRS